MNYIPLSYIVLRHGLYAQKLLEKCTYNHQYTVCLQN